MPADLHSLCAIKVVAEAEEKPRPITSVITLHFSVLCSS